MEKEALALTNTGVVVLRPGFMYGNDGYNSQATDWFEMGAAGEGIYRGDREKSWSWIHIEDLAEAFLLAAEADRSIDGELFCLADDRQPLCVDVMRRCVSVAGYTGEIRFEGPLEGNNTSTWFDQNELMTSEKARRILGWVPRACRYPRRRARRASRLERRAAHRHGVALTQPHRQFGAHGLSVGMHLGNDPARRKLAC